MRLLQERGLVVTALKAQRQEPSPTQWQRRKRAVVSGAVGAAVVAADQVTKSWAQANLAQHHFLHVFGPVSLILTYNSGTAFGLGRGATPVVEAVVIVLVAALVAFGRKASRSATMPMAILWGLLMGGAVSNLCDRLFRANHGAVIDFIDIARIGRHSYWPVFNLADASIVVGSVGLVLAYWLRGRRELSKAAES